MYDEIKCLPEWIQDKLDEFLEVYDLEFILEHADDLDYIPGYSYQDLAYEFIEQLGSLDCLRQETLERYFDYEAFGRDLILGGDYSETRHGFIRMI